MRKTPTFVISYRRDDTGGEAGRLRDSLIERLGRDTVFFDHESIPPGQDFKDALDRAVASCTVLIALIGPKWETVPDEHGQPRLHDDQDFVRNEVRAGLDRRIPVVPILINREAIPRGEDLPHVLRPLTRRQVFAIRADRWHQDVDLLVQRLGLTPRDKADTGARGTASQARFVSATVEWKRMPRPNASPRRWVVYVDNPSDAPITVEDVVVKSGSSHLTIEDWGPVRPSESSDYELEEADFDPLADRPEVTVRFIDSFGHKWVFGRGSLRRRG